MAIAIARASPPLIVWQAMVPLIKGILKALSFFRHLFCQVLFFIRVLFDIKEFDRSGSGFVVPAELPVPLSDGIVTISPPEQNFMRGAVGSIGFCRGQH